MDGVPGADGEELAGPVERNQGACVALVSTVPIWWPHARPSQARYQHKRTDPYKMSYTQLAT
jgi:hypothetical protein